MSNDNSSLFSVPPQVQPDGSLTYTPALLALGVAHVTVQAQDNGGNSHNGHDTSPSQTFTITVIL